MLSGFDFKHYPEIIVINVLHGFQKPGKSVTNCIGYLSLLLQAMTSNVICGQIVN